MFLFYALHELHSSIFLSLSVNQYINQYSVSNSSKTVLSYNSNRQSIIPPGRHLVGRGHSVRGAVRASPVRQLQPGGAGGEDQRGAAGQPASGADRHRGLSGLRHQMSPAGSSQQVARASFFHVLSLVWVYLFCTGPGNNVPTPRFA
jgi:hypothetical protein